MKFEKRAIYRFSISCLDLEHDYVQCSKDLKTMKSQDNKTADSEKNRDVIRLEGYLQEYLIHLLPVRFD